MSEQPMMEFKSSDLPVNVLNACFDSESLPPGGYCLHSVGEDAEWYRNEIERADDEEVASRKSRPKEKWVPLYQEKLHWFEELDRWLVEHGAKPGLTVSINRGFKSGCR